MIQKVIAMEDEVALTYYNWALFIDDNLFLLLDKHGLHILDARHVMDDKIILIVLAI